MPKKITHDIFLAKMQISNPYTLVLGTYKNSNTKIECQCKVCGYIWSAVPSSLLRGHGCKICGHIQDTKKRTKSTEEFIQELSLINPDIKVLGKYSTARKTIKCRCQKCNLEWEPIAGLLLKGRSCPRCAHSSTSYFEQCIFLSFEKAVGPNGVKSRDVSAIGKELDIYVPSLNFAVEPGAWFWHKDKLDRDRIKRELCKSKGISLWTIYDGFTDTLPPFNTNCICFSEDLSDNTYADKLFSLVQNLFSSANISMELSEEEWRDIQCRARLNSRRKTTQEFIEELQLVDGSINIVGEYLNSTTPIKCECAVCGHKWESTPANLLAGAGCSICVNQKLSESRTKSNEQFTSEVASILPNVILLEPYKNVKSKIQCQCRDCGTIWYAHPGNLLKGCGCRKCSYIEIANKNRKKETDFKNQLFLIDQNIEVTSSYIGIDHTINVFCKKCGHRWSPRAADLLHSKGCPVCSRKKRAELSRKSNETFLKELSKISSTIIPLEEYELLNKKIMVKCSLCTHIWNVTPKSLLQGNGCPQCARKRNANSRKKSIEQLTLDGKLIQTFCSCEEASKKTCSSLTGIQAVARGARKSCNGFRWRYIDD